MSFAKNHNKKVKRFSSWSAPAVMSAFLVICLLVIYSFETIGLTGREMNLAHRNENMLIYKKLEKKMILEAPVVKVSEQNNMIFSTKSFQLQAMQRILLDGTENQMKYERTGEYKLNTKNKQMIYY